MFNIQAPLQKMKGIDETMTGVSNVCIVLYMFKNFGNKKAK